MLPLFILGIALLIGMILVLRWYVSTDPKTGHVAGFILFRLRF